MEQLTEEQLFSKLSHTHKDVLIHLEENREVGLYKKIVFSWHYPSEDREKYLGSFWIIYGIINEGPLYSNGDSYPTVEDVVKWFNKLSLNEETREKLLHSNEWFDLHEMKIKKKTQEK